MSIEKVRSYFAALGKESEILEFPVSSATVELAAQALGVDGCRIAKTLSFTCEEAPCRLIVTAGDAKIDNGRYKRQFGQKARMLPPEETESRTGHAPGGVCPFANPRGVQVYLDVSLRRFETVYPACGSSNSAICLTPDTLFQLSDALEWVDVCKGWRPEEAAPSKDGTFSSAGE